jgi:hypothetical protein
MGTNYEVSQTGTITGQSLIMTGLGRRNLIVNPDMNIPQ